ncbi:MAG: hypothetical protein U9Q67_04455 [Patescibacteria group bacterium]|nr:hypothetical protein [Patescibacteria group bacterium]
MYHLHGGCLKDRGKYGYAKCKGHPKERRPKTWACLIKARACSRKAIRSFAAILLAGICVMPLSSKSLAYDGEDPFEEVVIYQQVWLGGNWSDHVEFISPWSPVFKVEIENTGMEPVASVMIFEAVACNAGLLFSRVGLEDDWGCVNEGLYFKVIDPIPPGSSVVFEHEFNLKGDVENGSYYCVAHAAVTTADYFEVDDVSQYKEVNLSFAIDVDWAQNGDGGEGGGNGSDEGNGDGETGDGSNDDGGSNNDNGDDNEAGGSTGSTGSTGNTDNGTDVNDGSMDDTSSMSETEQLAPQNSASIDHLAENLNNDFVRENSLARAGAEVIYVYFVTGIILICYNIFYVARCKSTRYKRRCKAKPV